jgi:peptidoglycan/xylan/chitin deacetylase (PgdA/CDA1 family)
MEDNHSVAAPILAEYALPATVYVTTGSIGAPNPFIAPEAGARMMSAEQIADLAASGWEIGSHTVTHPDMAAMDYAECRRELAESKATLEEIVGAPLRTFAYPFGNYGPAAMAAARDTGFEAALTCVNRGSWAPFEMKRTLITGRDRGPGFVARLSGAYEPLVLGRAGTLARRATRRLRRRG